MMSDAKALRYARLLKQYCKERPCRDGVCVFRQKLSGVCPLTDGRLPEDWQIDHARTERQNE